MELEDYSTLEQSTDSNPYVDIVLLMAELQEFSGSWRLTEKLATALRLPLDKITKATPKGKKSDLGVPTIEEIGIPSQENRK
ncbi:unnamed protein product [Protopolystoma xenopodis]|uniref:Uncharacterized protein n=1 Tax=Protopolystoma xenopodis TaxID=117903 RepID=A0A3S5FDN8_9PLAT|nr:unnamed protein product [Protopolystoma xenopodis]